MQKDDHSEKQKPVRPVPISRQLGKEGREGAAAAAERMLKRLPEDPQDEVESGSQPDES